MRRGRIEVSVELYNGSEWPKLEAELSNVFTVEAKETMPFGIISMHGISPLFDEAPELSSPRYDAVFTLHDDKIRFSHFIKL